MSKALSLTYRDAVRLLVDDEEILAQLDRLLGLGLLAAAPFAPAVVLPLFDAKGELISRLKELVSDLKTRTSKASDFDRQCMLIAAHAVIVMASFLEELSTRLAVLDSDGRWRKEIRSWNAPRHRSADVTDENVGGGHLTRIVEWSGRSLIEPPTPTRPMEKVTDDILRLYRTLSRDALDYIRGLARWDELNETRRDEIERSLIEQLPIRAVSRYRGDYIRLAGEVPDFLVWILINDLQATRELTKQLLNEHKADLRNLEQSIAHLAEYVQNESAALASIPQIVDDLHGHTAHASQAAPSKEAYALTLHYGLQRIVLNKPVLRSELADDRPGLTFPKVINGYINPRFRMAEIETSNAGLLLAQEDWWHGLTAAGTAIRPIRSGLAAHLASHLTTSRAMSVPLVILGHPGSGKSLFSRVVAAQLPPERYLVVRVELRHVDPSASVAEQVDASVRRESNGAYGWRELSDGTGKRTRIIILDGLDELLQLSGQEGLGRYLERVQDFQEREDALEHPTAAIVTARTLVMDRIYVPPGTVALKLEDFDDNQINTWLSVWNQTNQGYFAENGLQPCTADIVTPHRHIAGQPLLLMMLALYDADDNALHTTDQLTQADLYESLFRRFAAREVGKEPTAATRPGLLDQQIDERLEELSVIAIGLFNRGRKFITREEVEHDLAQLGIRGRGSAALHRSVTPDMALSQFFFLYKAEIVDSREEVRHGYEFLHTTFGEFLVARALTRALDQVGKLSDRLLAWDADALPKTVAQYLAPYLAHRPMIAETQLLEFVRSICATWPDERHPAVEVLLEALGALLYEFRPTGDYRPRSQSTTAATAAWSLNILLVTLIADAESIYLTPDLLGSDPIRGWRRLAQLWKSQLEADDWDAIIQFFMVTNAENEAHPIKLTFQRDHGDPSVASAQYPAQAEAMRLLLEARLTMDESLEASAAVWIGVLNHMSAENMEDNSTKLLVSQAINFSLGSNFEAATSWAEFFPKLSDALNDWTLPFLGVGPAGWSDEGLINLAALFRSAEANQNFKITNQIDILSFVLRELADRGYPDIAEQMLRSLRKLPQIHDDSSYKYICVLIQLSYEFHLDALKQAILAALGPSSARTVARLLSEDAKVFKWFSSDVSGSGRIANPPEL